MTGFGESRLVKHAPQDHKQFVKGFRDSDTGNQVLAGEILADEGEDLRQLGEVRFGRRTRRHL